MRILIGQSAYKSKYSVTLVDMNSTVSCLLSVNVQPPRAGSPLAYHDLPPLLGSASRVFHSLLRGQSMASLHANPHPLKSLANGRRRPCPALNPTRLRCSAFGKSGERSYSITLLPGDGIGPEVVAVAKDVLSLAGSLEGKSLSLKIDLLSWFFFWLKGVNVTKNDSMDW